MLPFFDATGKEGKAGDGGLFFFWLYLLLSLAPMVLLWQYFASAAAVVALHATLQWSSGIVEIASTERGAGPKGAESSGVSAYGAVLWALLLTIAGSFRARASSSTSGTRLVIVCNTDVTRPSNCSLAR